MPKLYQVKGKELIDVAVDFIGTIELSNGDVYVFDSGEKMFIWLGSKCSVDEKGVAAWVTAAMADSDPDEEMIITLREGEEVEGFNYDILVVDGNTPGFLTDAPLDMVTPKLYRVFTKAETRQFDETFTEEVPLDRSSLRSDDVFVLDANEVIYVWIGKDSEIEEKFSAQKFAQLIDSSRSYLPLSYSIYEGEDSGAEEKFFELLEKAKLAGASVSIEDRREADYS